MAGTIVRPVSEFAPELRQFVVSSFSSLEQVEVFLHLFRSAERLWTVEEVGEALEMAPESVGMRLYLLGVSGLVVGEGSPVARYRFNPTPGLGQLTRMLERVYEEDRQALLDLIGGSGSSTPARHFAGAFRLRKP